MYIIKRLALIVLVFIAFFGSGLIEKTEATSYSQPFADLWFSLKYELNISKLPQGLSIKPSGGGNLLYNETDYPLYIVKYNTSNKIYENSELPQKYIPIDKLTKDIYYFYDTYKTSLAELSGDEGPHWEKTITNYVVMENTYSGFFTDTLNKREDGRPENVEIPGPVTFNILTYYQGREIPIPVKVIYSLNKDYNPTALSDGEKIQSQRQRKELIISPVFWIMLIIAFLILFLIYKIFRKWPRFWGSGIYLIIVLTMLFGEISSLAVYDTDIWEKIFFTLNSPGFFVQQQITGSYILGIICFFAMNIVVYTLTGLVIWEIYKKLKKEPFDIQNGN